MLPFERLFRLMTRPWMIGLIILSIIIIYQYVDKPLIEFLGAAKLRHNYPFLNWITNLGIGEVYFCGFILLGFFFRYILIKPRYEACAWFLLLCLSFSSLICGILKVFLGRARPSMWIEKKMYGFYGFHLDAPFLSFPSGHTTTVMSVSFALAILFPRYCYAFIIFGITVAISRILIIQHYLSDVMFASYISLLEIGFVLYILQKKSWLKDAWSNKNYDNESSTKLQCF